MNHDIHRLIERLRQEPAETEWLEFKAKRYEPQELGEYLSALANSAALSAKRKGYLVFGIENRTHKVVGTTFNPQQVKGKGNQSLLIWLAMGLQPNVGYEHFHVQVDAKRVVLFAVNAALDRPVKFYGQGYVRVGSSKTALANHPEKERALWTRREDWTAQICEQARLSDLDPDAVTKARREYQAKYSGKRQDVEAWDDATFLNKARITVRDRLQMQLSFCWDTTKRRHCFRRRWRE